MFSNVIRYVASYITGGSLNEEVSSDEKDTGGKFITDSNDTDETPEPDCNQTNKLEEDIVEPAEGNGQQTNNSSGDTSNALEQTLYGTVTSFFNTRGLINDEIYFSQQVVIGSDHPKVGDNVVVKASRSHKAGGWVATSVQITALWDIDDDEETQAKPVKDNIIGTVIKLYGNMVQIKATIDFQVPISKFKTGYRPFNGDWINIEIWNKGDEFQVSGIQVNDIISISPLREKKITGTVTDIQSRNGVINSEVYFSFAICKRGTFYKKGDKVTAMVIESKQTQGNWRAVYIEHIKKEEKEDEPRTPKDVSLKNIFNGISIAKELAFGDINLGERQKKTIFIRNQGQKPVTFQSLNLSIPVPGFLFKLKNRGHRNSRNNRDLHMLSPNLILNPGEKKELPVEFIPSNIGKVEFNVTFHFDTFELETLVKANIVDSIQQEMQREITPFKAPQTFFGKKVNASFADATSVIPGQRLVRKKKVFLPNKLARYPIPNHVKTCLMNLDGDIELLVPELAQPLHISNYTRKLSTLLYAEEIKMEAEMRQFDLFQVILRKSHEYLTLDVPGLAEGRPSLLLGDRVVVQYHEFG
uniref:Uncharacterized protein n=1 Tax=Clytia hemisphaerica TaxID=252671 RepID=A0A7M5WSS0_9CNID